MYFSPSASCWVIQENAFCPLPDVKLPGCYLETQLPGESRTELPPLQSSEPRTAPCPHLSSVGVGEKAKHEGTRRMSRVRPPPFAPPPTQQHGQPKASAWTWQTLSRLHGKWPPRVWGDGQTHTQGAAERVHQGKQGVEPPRFPGSKRAQASAVVAQRDWGVELKEPGHTGRQSIFSAEQ